MWTDQYETKYFWKKKKEHDQKVDLTGHKRQCSPEMFVKQRFPIINVTKIK